MRATLPPPEIAASMAGRNRVALSSKRSNNELWVSGGVPWDRHLQHGIGEAAVDDDSLLHTVYALQGWRVSRARLADV